MTILVAMIAVAALSLALGLGVAQRRDRRRIDARLDTHEAGIAGLQADHAAVPTEVRALRAGEIAIEMDARRKLHDVRSRVTGHEERLDALADRLAELEGDAAPRPGDTLTGGRRNGR